SCPAGPSDVPCGAPATIGKSVDFVEPQSDTTPLEFTMTPRASSSLDPPRYVDQTSWKLPINAGSKRVTNASCPPPIALWKPARTGKFTDFVAPTTVTSPLWTSIPFTASASVPPRNVDQSSPGSTTTRPSSRLTISNPYDFSPISRKRQSAGLCDPSAATYQDFGC